MARIREFRNRPAGQGLRISDFLNSKACVAEHEMPSFLLQKMRIRYYTDFQSGLPHIHRHGVDEAEVEDILRNPNDDRPGREGARVAIGRTQAGRYVRVIYVPDPEPDSVFIITAYELTGKPLKAFRRRTGRRRE